jgi:hypothetical protein
VNQKPTTGNHPITVPAGSITGWRTLYLETYVGNLSKTEYIAANAAQWGADQELEACCEALNEINPGKYWSQRLRVARRPKPPSLKEQALEALVSINSNFHVYGSDIETIRRALEALPND